MFRPIGRRERVMAHDDAVPAPVFVTCGAEDCDFCPAPVLPENADAGFPCVRTGEPMRPVKETP